MHNGCSTRVHVGPLLIKPYINDVAKQCHGIEIQMYADDPVVCRHAKTAGLTTAKLAIALEQMIHCHL